MNGTIRRHCVERGLALLSRLVVVRRGGRVDATGDTGEEAIPESGLCLHAEVLDIADVVLSLVLLGLDQTINEVVVLHLGYQLGRLVLTHANTNVQNVT